MRANTVAKLLGLIVAAAVLCGAEIASAQYSFVQTPFNGASNSFYENIGTSWALQGRGWFANFGGAAGAGVPAGFGGFDPNAQANLGVGFRGNGFSGRFNLTAGQGSDMSLTTSTPGVTVANGGIGFFSDVQQRPFVLGIVPVVGEPVSPLKWRLERMAETGESPGAGPAKEPGGEQDGGGSSSGKSTAERGDLSVAAIKAQQAEEEAAKASEVAELLAKAREYEAAGKIAIAKIQYRRAAQRATGKEQQEIAAKLRELEKK
jgi:hypothetical protein